MTRTEYLAALRNLIDQTASVSGHAADGRIVVFDTPESPESFAASAVNVLNTHAASKRKVPPADVRLLEDGAHFYLAVRIAK